MSILKPSFAFIFGISIVGSADASGKIQCVDVDIPEYNLKLDVECNARRLISKKLPDQDFVVDVYPSKVFPSCFRLVVPGTSDGLIDGTITDPATGKSIEIKVAGFAAFTLSTCFPPLMENMDCENPASFEATPFTAAAVFKLFVGHKAVGKLFTRDSGTAFNLFDFPISSAITRISIAQGTKKLEKVTGYIDEVGRAFDSKNPAFAHGKLCGRNIFKKFADDEDKYYEYDKDEVEDDEYED